MGKRRPSEIERISSIEIEKLALAAILVNSPNALGVLDSLPLSDFSTEGHRHILSAMQFLRTVGMGIDRVSVIERLRTDGHLEAAGGISYLTSLDDGMPQVPQLETWTKILHEKGTARELANIYQYGRNRVLAGEGTAAEIFADVGERLAEIGKNGAGTGSLSVRGLVKIFDVNFDGIKFLVDPVLPEGALVALTGDAASGKSSLCSAWLRDIARTGRPCLILDRDNPYQVVRDRFERLGITEAEPIEAWGAWQPEPTPQPDAKPIVDWVNECTVKPAIMVDSVSGFIEGNENDSEPMLALMLRLRKIADLGATVVVLHNTGKGDTTRDFRGHSSFKDKADQAFLVTNMGGDLLDKIHVRCFKSRFGFSGRLLYRYDDGNFTCDKEKLAVSKAETEELTSILRKNPGAYLRSFESLAMNSGIGRDKARDFLHIGIEFQEIRTEPGPRKTVRHFLVERAKTADALFS